MKKIIFFIVFFIILLLSYFVIVRGKTNITLSDLYIEEGVGNDTYLYNDNYELISGAVNWNREGTYMLNYQDEIGNIYSKNIVIIPKKDYQYLITKNEEINIKIDSNNIIMDIFYITDSSFYVISNYQMPDPTAPDQEKISVIYYENYEFKWEYRYYKYSRFVSASLYNDNIIVTGLVYNENNYYINSIVLFEVTKERQIIKSREISSDKPCFVYNLYVDNDIIYLITNTNGTKFDYEKYKTHEISQLVIFEINYNTFQIDNGICNEEIKNFFIIDTSYYDRRLTINIQFKEKQGLFTNCIYEYNDRLELVDKYYFTIENKDYICHQVTRDEICIFAIDYSVNSDCVKVEYLQNNVENKNILLDLYNNYVINNIEIVNVEGNDIYICMNNKTIKGNHFLGYCKVNSLNKVTYFSTTTEDINIIKSKISNGILINFYSVNNRIYTKILKLIEIKTINYDNNLEKNIIKKLYVNCIELNKNKHLITTNKNKFGIYKNIYKYLDSEYNEYFLEDTIEVKLDCNIEENNIYQTGYKIRFNGEGTLNGEEINNEYIINDIGKYQLVIKGNTDTKLITFSIDDLTINSINRETIKFNINSINIKPNIYNPEQYIDNKYEFIQLDTSKEMVPLSLAILSIGIIIFLFMRKKA